MKIRQISIFTGFVFALPAVPVLLAIEAPSDDAPPPAAARQAQPAVEEQQADVRPQPKKTPIDEKAVGFLGVVTQQVPKLLAGHLKLEDGQGVVVQAVSPGGPAEKAGIQQGDIITALDGKPVGSSADLTRLVSESEPGKIAKVHSIHQGQRGEVEVTLGTRPKDLAAVQQPLQDLQLDGVPRELADRVRGMIEQNLGENGIAGPMPGMGIQADEAMKALQQQMRKAMEQAENGNPEAGFPGIHGGVAISGESVVRMLEPDGGSIELKSKDGSKEVTIRDKDNRISWSGPWDSEQDKAAAPPDVRKRLDKLNILPNLNGNGLRMQLGNAVPDEAPAEE